MADADMAYAAGIIDGEGSILISETKSQRRERWPLIRAVVRCEMTDEAVIRWLAEMFGGTVHSRLRLGLRPTWAWVVQGDVAADACHRLLPYLRIKDRQAELLIRFRAECNFTNPGRRGLGDDEVNRRRVFAQTARALNRGVA